MGLPASPPGKADGESLFTIRGKLLFNQLVIFKLYSKTGVSRSATRSDIKIKFKRKKKTGFTQ